MRIELTIDELRLIGVDPRQRHVIADEIERRLGTDPAVMGLARQAIRRRRALGSGAAGAIVLDRPAVQTVALSPRAVASGVAAALHSPQPGPPGRARHGR